jgi:hypothetical protein
MAQQRGHGDVAGYLQGLIDAKRRRQEDKFQLLRNKAAKTRLKLRPGL